MEIHPLIVMAIGIGVVIGMIIWLRVNAFISLITAAIVVSLLAPGELANKISRVFSAFGSSAAGVGVVIAMAAIIGKCMMDSGAADKIVRSMMKAFGKKRTPFALTCSGYVLSVPVFFDTVFYLLIPLARSLYRKTGGNYLKYVMAITVGGVATHALVPPTPGPLLMADQLNVDLGTMILIGAAVAFPASMVALWVGGKMDAAMNIEMREVEGDEPKAPLEDSQLPSLWWALMPVLLPIVLISSNTAIQTYADAEHAARFTVTDVKDYVVLRERVLGAGEGDAAARYIQSELPEEAKAALENMALSEASRKEVVTGLNKLLSNRTFYDAKAFLGMELSGTTKGLLGRDRGRMRNADVERMNRLLLENALGDVIVEHEWNTERRQLSNVMAVVGNPGLTLIVAAALAMFVLSRQRRLSRDEMAKTVEVSLMSGGVIILITAAGGAFGAMLKAAEVGGVIEEMFKGDSGQFGLGLLVISFVVAAVIKFAQGSSTVAMITTAGMMAAVVVDVPNMPYNPVYLATAIGSGSLVGSWMNDSGFWIFSKMGGFTEAEALKTWTPGLAVVGCTAMVMTLILATVLPLV